jgi:histone acetyltransferase MYST4
LTQALGPHIPTARQNFQNNHHRLSSGSPSNSPILSQNDLQFVASPQSHAGPSNLRSPLHQFSIPLPGGDHDAITAGKRKQVDESTGGQVKRRREGEENEISYENHESGLGAKHWTDDEKSRLFNWLMAPDQNDHWASLRAAKNSCLREVSRQWAKYIHERLICCSVQQRYSATKKHIRLLKGATSVISMCSNRYMRSSLSANN